MAEQSMIPMARRLEAGREYLAALVKLGFSPDAVFWAGVAKDARPDELELIIISTWVDSIGPKAVYDLLFAAYDRSATPKEIDPFNVSLFSPESNLSKAFARAVEAIPTGLWQNGRPLCFVGQSEYFTIPDWVIFHQNRRKTLFADQRRFGAFRRNITRLAA